jgi:hypothetical protein
MATVDYETTYRSKKKSHFKTPAAVTHTTNPITFPYSNNNF